MVNYHTSLVLTIDCALLAAYLAFAVILIIYILVRDSNSRNRVKRLLNIKNDVSRLFLSGDKPALLTPSITKATVADFLDIETNGQRQAVFFNESEQQLFKEHFITAGRIKTLESLAKKSLSRWRRIEAIIALGYTQADSALDILEESLYDRDEDISYFSALAIGQISTMRSVSVLMHFLKEKPLLRRKIASILETLSPDITDETIKFTDDADPEVRVWAVRLLSKAVSKDYMNKVASLTLDPSPDVRAAACDSLAILNNKNSKDVIANRLRDDIWLVRMHAVRALAKLFGKDSVPEIIRLLSDGSLSVLDSVRNALAANIDAALPYMQKIFEGPDELPKKICIEAIESSGCTIKILHDALSDDRERRIFANRILTAMVKANAHLGLESALKEMDEGTTNRLLEIVRSHDAGIALHIEKILANELNEL